MQHETGRHVLKWWQANHHKFVYFQTAACLIALVPVTSASIKRVFRQVKILDEPIGENVLQETIETHLMEQVINVYMIKAGVKLRVKVLS